MIFPTPKAALLLASSIPIAGVLCTISPKHSLFAFFIPTLTLIIIFYDYARSLNPGLLRATLSPPQALSVGSPEPFPITITFEGKTGSLPISLFLSVMGELKVKSSDDFLNSSVKLTLTSGKGETTLILVPLRRGWAYLDKLYLAYRGPLGFVELRLTIWIGHNFYIRQDIKKVYQDALTFLSEEASIGQKSQPYLGEGSEFDNLRDFAPGMDNRFIDWKHSARHRRLLAKEFNSERNQHLILGFDTGRLMLEQIGNDTRLDHFIRAGLSLGWISLRQGDLVGSCAFDLFFRNFLSPGRTPSFFRKLQTFTSQIDYRTFETNFTLSLTELASRLKQRSLVVLFTEFSDSASSTLLLECLELLIKKHTVIFVSTPDPVVGRLPDENPTNFVTMAEAVIAEKLNFERAIVLERMARLGVHTLDVKGPLLSSSLIRRYLAIKKRGNI